MDAGRREEEVGQGARAPTEWGPGAGESLRTRLVRWRFNFFPAYRGTGGRITHIAGDWSEMRVRIPLGRRTRNYVGTIFGGSIYGAVDPIHMIMLIQRLGPDYVVWDKAASIRFRRPGRSTLHARVLLPDEEVEEIRSVLAVEDSTERLYGVQLLDEEGEVHAFVEKTIHVRRRGSARA